MKAYTVKVETAPYTYREIGEFDDEKRCWDAIERSVDQHQDCDFIICDNVSDINRRIGAHKLYKESCPECGKKVMHLDMQRTYDCHGIPFRMVCHNCYVHIMETKGYDGEYYTDADECIDSDY